MTDVLREWSEETKSQAKWNSEFGHFITFDPGDGQEYLVSLDDLSKRIKDKYLGVAPEEILIKTSVKGEKEFLIITHRRRIMSQSHTDELCSSCRTRMVVAYKLMHQDYTKFIYRFLCKNCGEGIIYLVKLDTVDKFEKTKGVMRF